MDPFTASVLVGGAGEVIGGLFGGDDEKRARRERERALAELAGLNVEAGPSSLNSYNADPRLRLAQVGAMDELGRVGREGGMDIGSRVALREAQNATSAQERGSREAILQSMAARGQGGGGAELAAQLTNQQGAASRDAATGARAAADARTRALMSLTQSGQLAGQTRGQDFGEAAGKAGAQDAINQFNASQRLSRGTAVAGLRTGNAGSLNQDAARERSRNSGILSAGGQVLGAVGAKKGWF
jgi:hypothetical protein